MAEAKNPALQGTILDLIKGSVVTAALFLAYLAFPLIGMIPGIFAPAPGIYYSLKRGRWVAAVVVLVTAAALLATPSPGGAVIYLLQAGVLTLVMPLFLSRNLGGARALVYSIAINLLVILAVAGIYGYLTGTNLHAKLRQGVQASIVQTVATYQKLGVTGDDLKNMQASMQQAASVLVSIYPALITVALGFIAILNLQLVSRIALRVRMPLYVGDFRKFRNPEPMVWLLIVSGFALLQPYQLVYLGALNITIVLCALYTVQGFAVISHYFTRLAVPRYARAILVLLLILQPFLLLGVTALGIFDLWGNFRSPRKKTNL